MIDKEINRLTKFFGGLVNLQSIPEAIFVVDCNRESAAIKEAAVKGVKVFALVDTNTDPDKIDLRKRHHTDNCLQNNENYPYFF